MTMLSGCFFSSKTVAMQIQAAARFGSTVNALRASATAQSSALWLRCSLQLRALSAALTMLLSRWAIASPRAGGVAAPLIVNVDENPEAPETMCTFAMYRFAGWVSHPPVYELMPSAFDSCSACCGVISTSQPKPDCCNTSHSFVLGMTLTL